ncbi:tRNA synthetases class I-domain-containing protein [Mycena metata]|uniref:Valine--tRNA ligase, mitochondrial n=1 Tax=Mycena metata TaxID=1033252 RepID=A0AAD7NRN1_9AGAR|nr:tRNA synthetases class I-domain-containing protein [Mycena metata]
MSSANPPSGSKRAKEAKKAEKLTKFAAKSARPKAQNKPAVTEDRWEDSVYVNITPTGEKKGRPLMRRPRRIIILVGTDVSQPMGSAYNPTAVESAWYDWWEAQGFFKPQMAVDGTVKPEGVFVIPAPPPNVTGSLHIGHALTTAIQDCLVRWNRMLGKTTLFAPGFDHAGISTQSVVEARLYKTSGQTRHDLGRDKFLGIVLQWKNEYQDRITNQLRRLGGSYDWSRTAFTMDEGLSKAVIETFCRLREHGIIYRANRLVNWCVKMNTTLSNLEVEETVLTGRTLMNVPGYDLKEMFEFGVMTSFAYPVEDSGGLTLAEAILLFTEGLHTDERIIVATTRPETMLGDTAVAIHSKDTRYLHLHGKFVVHPFNGRRIPIVTDDIVVDMEFGTGAVKITPAHDANDYEFGQRHHLEFINILNDDGTFNANAGDRFKGMKRYHARIAVVKALKEAGLYVETKDHAMELRVCSKSGDIIEPIIKPQWYVKCQPLAEEAIARTKAGELIINPKQSEDEWFRWLGDLQDWCISRQLWWGHRCPAYFVRLEGDKIQDRNNDQNWVVGRNLEEATARAQVLANGAAFTLEQDEDVLDTWFSSGLWPFSIMGWPDHTPDLQHFYPSTVLETGWDILFFWVARMVLLGINLTDRVPFKEVYCHAMIRDAQGKKMSKSKGNVIDPIDVMTGISLESLHAKLSEGNLDQKEIQRAMEGQKKSFPQGIPQCGTDALRFALCAYSGGGRDINLEILRVEGYRKFCNKLFNATKFAVLKLDASFVPQANPEATGNETLVEQWILHKLNIAVREVNTQLGERNFMLATTSAYNFWLYELCDVYIEAMKLVTDEQYPAQTSKSAQQTLYTCLDHEELWQRLPRRPNDLTPSIMVASFPVFNEAQVFEVADRHFELVFQALKAGRSLAASYNLQTNVNLFFHAQSDEETELLQSQLPIIISLTKGCSSATIVRELKDVPDGCGGAVVTPSISVHVLVRGLIDIDVEIVKREKKTQMAQSTLQKIIMIQSQPEYTETVPANVRLGNEEKRKTLEAEISPLQISKETFFQLK